jgi:hypothetical protein
MSDSIKVFHKKEEKFRSPFGRLSERVPSASIWRMVKREWNDVCGDADGRGFFEAV